MHLSHLFEDLEAWYLNFDHRERVDTTFRPGLDVPVETLTVPQGPDDVQTPAQVAADYESIRRIGHSGSIQPSSRLAEDVAGPDGTLYAKGTAIPQRADFNTLDNPFFWTAHPDRDRFVREPAAGLHFVVFNPSSDDFQSQSAGDGRRAPRRHGAAVRAALARAGLQRGPADDASPELPRAAAARTVRSRSRSCAP